jgi:ferric-dicitrate binding protein FerR (iron transport regulator)
MDTKSYNRAKAILDEFYAQDASSPELTERFRLWLSDDRHAAPEKEAALEQLYDEQMGFDEWPDQTVYQDYEQLKGILGLATAAADTTHRDHPHTTQPHTPQPHTPIPHTHRLRTLWRVAAVLLPAVVLTGAGWLFYGRHAAPAADAPVATVPTGPVYADIHVEAPQDMEMALPDGSFVYMHKSSSLVYSDDFRHNRSLTLKGEADFKVNKRKDASPFTVRTQSGLSVVATGTEFKVQAYNHDRYTVVWLYEGGLNIHHRTDTYPLTSGQQLIFDQELDHINVKDVQLATPKTLSDVITFPRTPLRDILQWIESYYGVRVDVHQNSIVGNITAEPVSVKFTRTDSLDEALLRLSIITGTFRYTIVKDADGLLRVNILPIVE